MAAAKLKGAKSKSLPKKHEPEQPKLRLPAPIALVAFGYKVPDHLKKINEIIAGANVTDVRPHLPRQRNGPVDHTQNGTYTNTQAKILACPQFGDYAVSILKDIAADPYSIGLSCYGCTQGEHRADVLVRMLEQVLNSVVLHGERVFHAKTFCLNESKVGGVAYALDNAKEWMAEPWLPLEATHVSLSDRKSLYGYAGAQDNRVAFKQFTTIIDFGENVDLLSICSEMIEGMPLPDEERADEVDDETEDPPDEEDDCDYDEPPPPPPAKKARTSSWKGKGDSKGKGERKSMCSMNEAVGESPPPWASDEFNVKDWWPVLHSRAVDHLAAQTLYLLAQYNEHGKKEAHSIISQLTFRRLDDASRFVHKCATQALNKVKDEANIDHRSKPHNRGKK